VLGLGSACVAHGVWSGEPHERILCVGPRVACVCRVPPHPSFSQLYHDWLRSVGPNASATHKRPPPLCTVLACLVDYAGFRVNVVCVPPMEEERTLVSGRTDPRNPFLQADPMLQSMLRRAAAVLNLRPHGVEWEVPEEERAAKAEQKRVAKEERRRARAAARAAAALAQRGVEGGEVEAKGQLGESDGEDDEDDDDEFEDTIAATTVSLSAQVQGHKCRDGRYYLMNLSRISPPDLPNLDAESGEIDTHLLRPELVQVRRVSRRGCGCSCFCAPRTLCVCVCVCVLKSW